MKRFLIILIVNCTLFIANCIAQSITWQRLYNGPYNQQDICKDLCSAPNGNFFAIGSSKKPTTQGYFIYILKLNLLGDTIWTRIIDSVSNDALSCAESGDGGVVIVGEGHFALKVDSSGSIAWKRFYNENGIRCYDIIKTADGGFLACGEQLNFTESGFHYDSYMMKLDFNGNILWDTTYLAGFDKPLISVLEINGVGYAFTGYVLNSPIDTYKCLILKTDYLGNVIWENNLTIFSNGAGGEKIDKILNGYLIAGGTSDTASVISKIFLLKIDTLGNTQSIKFVNSNITEKLTDFKIINSNKYVITSYYNIAKNLIVDSLGNIIVQKNYPTQYYTYLYSVLPQTNGDIIWGGVARYTIEDADVWIIRSDSLLNTPPIGIYTSTHNIPEDYLLYQNYPNPFNPTTQIKFMLSRAGYVKLYVYNLIGEKIIGLLDKELIPGEYQITFSGINLPSGIYFYQLNIDENIIISKKMILLK